MLGAQGPATKLSLDRERGRKESCKEGKKGEMEGGRGKGGEGEEEKEEGKERKEVKEADHIKLYLLASELSTSQVGLPDIKFSCLN